MGGGGLKERKWLLPLLKWNCLLFYSLNSKEEVELCEGSGKIAGEEGETQDTATGTERKACTGKTSHISVII